MALDKIRTHFFPRLDLSTHNYLRWTSTICHPPEFIDAHPDTMEWKIQANHAHPGKLEAFMAFNVDGRLNTIQVPTMVIIGNQYLLTPLP
jgi:hypothetical protein